MRGVVHRAVLSETTDERLRNAAINAAIGGFVLHLVACSLYSADLLRIEGLHSFTNSYLDALYTPFSIILAYEVYELIRAIPESFSNSIGKQFEVVTLLVVRDIFKNLSNVKSTDSTAVAPEVTFIALEAAVFVVLFSTSLYFRSLTHAPPTEVSENDPVGLFVSQKKDLACVLALVYVLVAFYSFSSWIIGVVDGEGDVSRTLFFSDFFTCLILSDIVILLVSYKHITEFTQLARNTGFVLSTVIVRVGIATPGYTGAVLFVLSAGLACVVLKLSVGSLVKPTR